MLINSWNTIFCRCDIFSHVPSSECNEVLQFYPVLPFVNSLLLLQQISTLHSIFESSWRSSNTLVSESHCELLNFTTNLRTSEPSLKYLYVKSTEINCRSIINQGQNIFDVLQMDCRIDGLADNVRCVDIAGLW